MKTETTKKSKYVLEFVINSSHFILYEFLSTPSGLAQWFADDVDVFHNEYTFIWDGIPQKAKLVDKRENEMIRFRWLDSPKEEYFEFKIQTTEITGDTVLMITDFSAPKDLKDAKLLWGSQLHELKMRLGGL